MHARKREERESPLIPRYLFVGVRDNQDVYKMRGIAGVEGVLRDGYGCPIKIPHPEPKFGEERQSHPLARLLDRELTDEFDFTRLPDRGPHYQPGEIVRLTAGVFAGLQAQVVSMLSKGRVEFLLDFMGRGAKVQMKATELQRLEAPE